MRDLWTLYENKRFLAYSHHLSLVDPFLCRNQQILISYLLD